MQSVGLQGFREDRFRLVLEHIRKNDENWDQSTWHGTDVEYNERPLKKKKLKGNECGTSHCFGGWCDLLSGRVDKMIEEVVKRVDNPMFSDLFQALNYGLDDVTDLNEGEEVALPKDLFKSTEEVAVEWLGRTKKDLGEYDEEDDDEDSPQLFTNIYHLFYRTESNIREVEEWFYEYVNALLSDSLRRISQGATTTKDRRLRIRARKVQNNAEHAWHRESKETVLSTKGPRLDTPLKYYTPSEVASLFMGSSNESVEKLIGHQDPVVGTLAQHELVLRKAKQV